jgi:hypothetical protein
MTKWHDLLGVKFSIHASSWELFPRVVAGDGGLPGGDCRRRWRYRRGKEASASLFHRGQQL